ncbi:MAG: heme biosynthesis HemY N-terminal domain-containing protein [Gammaproteobacteria bacterium]
MKYLVHFIILSVLVALAVLMYHENDIGYINIGLGQYQYSTTLLVLGAGLLALSMFVYVLARISAAVARLFTSLGRRNKKRLEDKSRNALTQGLIELAEGRFDSAEKMLLQRVEQSESSLLNYLAAARAAQQLGAHDRRDEYLRLAHQATPTADIAIGLTKAELQLAHDQTEQALATLLHLSSISPKHVYVLKLLAKTYQQLADWQQLIELVPELKKYDVLPQDKLLTIEVAAWNGLLREITTGKSYETLTELWNEMPHHVKTQPELLEHYARSLVEIGATGEAEKQLRSALKNNWQDSTIQLYSELDVLISGKQFEAVEGWLNDHPCDAYLLLALGKLAMGLTLWGKARSYLEASISCKPIAETYVRLAVLLEEHLDEAVAAQNAYRQGMHLLAGDYGNEALIRAENDFQRILPADYPAADAGADARPELKVV